ncbi:hypothetical protein MNBD_GAMMA16-311 [hydrothermal vent metagenome]|uniref:Uncharacterized protein n=1 Tax=hydrothermal vent metagenome TaxID=652676 RepID=A0A3B0ZB33_9ZZZZ
MRFNCVELTYLRALSDFVAEILCLQAICAIMMVDRDLLRLQAIELDVTCVLDVESTQATFLVSKLEFSNFN